MEGQLFNTRYIPIDEKDLAEYILRVVPFAKESPTVFNETWLEHVLETQFTSKQKARLAKFNLVNGNRRKQELQQLPEYAPSHQEKQRRMYLARGEHLSIT